MKKYSGVRERVPGHRYEVSFRPARGAKTVFRNIEATSKAEAYLKRAELMVEASKPQGLDFAENIARTEVTFDSIWEAIDRNLKADNLASKTQTHLKKIYFRLFNDFRLSKFPQVKSPADLTLPFFLEYKSYYAVELNMPKGLRAEMQRVKGLMSRMRRLRYCSAELLSDLEEIKLPQANEKEYPPINNTAWKEFINAIKKDRPDIYGVAYFMARVGRRVEEVTLIKRSDIIWDGINPIQINIRSETAKQRRKDLLNILDTDLQNHIRTYYQLNKDRQSPYLFLMTKSGRYKNLTGYKFNQKRVTEYIGKLSESMLKVRITSHYFRHRFCTETCKAGLPLKDIQAICGIKNIEILLKHYSHSSKEGQISVLEKTKL